MKIFSRFDSSMVKATLPQKIHSLFTLLLLWLTASFFSLVGAEPEYKAQPLVILSYSDDDARATSIIKGPSGTIYTAGSGGRGTSTWTNGVVLKLTPAGRYVELATIPWEGDRRPHPVLHFADAQENLYLTVSSNVFGHTHFFRLTPSGELQHVHHFPPPMGRKIVSIVEGNDTFFGISESGGGSDYGTIFSLSKTGQQQTLFSFSVPGGIFPNSLAISPDGTFWGATTDFISVNAPDVVFKRTPEGQYSVVASSDRGEVQRPRSLIIGRDSAIYFIDSSFGPEVRGAIKRISPEGELTTLHSFNDWPIALIEASDGNLVCLAEQSLFLVSKQGAFKQISKFDGLFGGSDELETLIEGAPGIFYVLRGSDRPPFAAGVFRLAPAPELHLVRAPDVANNHLTWNSFPGAEYLLDFTDDLSLRNWQPWPMITATGESASATVYSGFQSQLFFRVRLLP